MSRFYKHTLILVVISFLLLTVPAVLMEVGIIDAYVAQILTLGGVNAIMAISVNVVCGITGQLSLGQAAFQALGAYTTILLTMRLHCPLPLSILCGGLVATIFGFLIGFPTLKLEGDYLAIVTLAFGEIIRVVLVNLKDLTGGPNGIQFSTVFTTNLAHGMTISWLSVIGSLIVIIGLLMNYLRSSYGRAIMAVREDEIAANSNGIGVFRYKMIGFVIASFIGGIGGALYAPFIGFVKPDIGSFNNSINHLIYVVLGGMGSVTGSVLAAFALTILQEFLRFLQDYRLLIYPLILIFVMLFRPQGLMDRKELSFVQLYYDIPDFFKKLSKGRLFHKKDSKKQEAK